MFLIAPITRGAHDGGMIGMILGLMIGQIIFSIWLLDFKWYLSIPFGFIIGLLTISFSYYINEQLSYSPNGISIQYSPIVTSLAGKNEYGYPENIDEIMGYIFFFNFLITSLILWEFINFSGKIFKRS